MRRVLGSHQRRRRDVHEFIGVWIHVPADVQQRVHGVRDELVHRGHFDRGDVQRAITESTSESAASESEPESASESAVSESTSESAA